MFYLYRRHYTFPLFPFSRNIPIVVQLYSDHFHEDNYILQEVCVLKIIVKICSLISEQQRPKCGLEFVRLPEKRLTQKLSVLLQGWIHKCELYYCFLSTYTFFHPYKMDTKSIIMWMFCLIRMLKLQFFVTKYYFLELKYFISLIITHISLMYCMVFICL